jgi:hypothetical protein
MWSEGNECPEEKVSRDIPPDPSRPHTWLPKIKILVMSVVNMAISQGGSPSSVA